MHSLSSPAGLLPNICLLARQAGDLLLSFYRSSFPVLTKTDGSPVTEADQMAEQLILAGLQRLVPDVPVVAEESISVGQIPDISAGSFWLVDPLDGTEAFIRHNGEFTVNIALIHKKRSVLGVIYAPVYNHLYSALDYGIATIEKNSTIIPIKTHARSTKNTVIVASRTYEDPNLLEAFLRSHKAPSVTRMSSALKLCLVAAGQADFYPRFSKTMEWDTAAGHAILKAAGGDVCTTSGEELHYGKPGFWNPHFIACGTPPC